MRFKLRGSCGVVLPGALLGALFNMAAQAQAPVMNPPASITITQPGATGFYASSFTSCSVAVTTSIADPTIVSISPATATFPNGNPSFSILALKIGRTVVTITYTLSGSTCPFTAKQYIDTLNVTVLSPVPPFTCSTSVAAVPTLRPEGITELAADILLICTGGTLSAPGTSIPTANISLLLNTQATSRIVGNGGSEALLLIDEPSTFLGCPSNTTCPMVGPPSGVALYGGTPGQYNVFQGSQTGPNMVEWLGVPLTAPGSTGVLKLRITNVRANANQLSTNAAGGSPILATLSSTGNSPLVFSNPQVTIGTAGPGLSVGVAPGSFQVCPTVNSGLPFSGTPATHGPAIANFIFTESSPYSFRSASPGTQPVVGAGYKTESGFTLPPSAGLDPNIGVAGSGTVLTATIPGVLPGVTFLIPQTMNLTDPSGKIAGTVQATSPGGVLPGSNLLVTPDSTGQATFNFQVKTRDVTNPGPLTLSAAVTFQYNGSTSSLPQNFEANIGFAAVQFPQTTLFQTGSALHNTAPVFGPLDSGVSAPPYVPAQLLASLVPCASSGTSLNLAGMPAPSFTGVTQPQAAATPGTTLIAPLVSNVGLVSTLLPANVTVTKDPTATWLNVTLNQSTTPVTASLSVNNAAAGVHSTTLQFNSPGAPSVSVPVTYTVAPAPWFTKFGFDHSASYVSDVTAPGEPFVIFGGDSFGPATLAPPSLGPDGRAISILGNTQVLFDGVPTPLYYSVDNNGTGQVAGFAPFGLAGKTQTNVQVVYNGVASPPVTLNVLDAVPGLYTADSSGAGQGSILNQDASINGPSNPEAVGNIVVLYGGGAGQTTPPGRDGALAGVGAALAQLTLPVKVFIDGIPATDITYAGPAPGIVEGVFQIDVRIPAGVRHNANVPVLVEVEDKQTQPGVTLATK